MTRFFLLAVTCLGLTSCLGGGANECSATQLEPITSAVGPKTLAVNQTATFTLSYVPLTACGVAQGFLEQTSTVANTKVVGVNVHYTDCNCPTSSVTATTTYAFTPTQPGTYYLNFIASANGVIADTLVVR